MGAFRARALAEHPGVECVLVGSRDRARAQAVASTVGARGGSIEQVLATELDAVVISTATADHARRIEACAEKGLPMLCEKPIALSLEETRAAIEQAERAGVVLQVAFQRRFDPGFRRARELIRGGSLGTLYSLRLTSHDHEPSPERYIPGSGGIFRDLHVHDFDIVRWLTGAEVEEVYAAGALRKWGRFGRYGDVDASAVLITLSGGIPVTVTGARHNPLGYDVRAEIFGSEDSVVVGLDSRSPLHSAEPGTAPPPANAYSGFLDRFAVAFRDETAAFVDVARGRGENPCPGVEALAALRVAIACDRSRGEGRPVQVGEIPE